MPAADIEITVELARALVGEQHPDLAALPIASFAHGWDNEVLALGDSLLLRIPRRATAATLIENELTWLSELAPCCTLPVPVPLRKGQPGAGYPYSWSIVPRLAGVPVGPSLLGGEAAEVLGRFVRALHVPAPGDAPRNPLRGVPLAERDERFDIALAKLEDRIDETRARTVWDRCLEVPAWSGPPVWLHGDLHCCNVLASEGVPCGVIDFGDVTAGDPATDLMIGFMAFEGAARAQFFAASGADVATLERGRGWAIALGAVFAASDDPVLSGLGFRTLAAALD